MRSFEAMQSPIKATDFFFGIWRFVLPFTVKAYIMADRGMSFWDWWSIKVRVYDITEADVAPDFVVIQMNGSPYLQTRGWRRNCLDWTTYMWTSKDYPSTRRVSANMLTGTTSSRISELNTVTETEFLDCSEPALKRRRID